MPNGRIDTVTEADFRELAKSRGARAAQAGRTTLKKAVVSASILSGAGQEGWNGILGSLVRQSGQQLDQIFFMLASSTLEFLLNPSGRNHLIIIRID